MAPSSILPGAGRRTAEKPAVLIVDDEFGPRESIAFTLGREFDVATADRGKLALEMVRGRQYDAVVLDIRMPDMDGIRTLEELRKIDAEVSVIMLTGYGTLQTAQQAMAGGANQYLRKPPDVAELLDAARRQVAATRERRAQMAAARQAVSLNEALRREIQEREPQIWQAKASVELVHDLSNPLSVVVGYSGLLADEARRLWAVAPKDAERLLAQAEVVAKAAQYCHHLAENWRGASKEAASFVPVDLPALVREVLSVVLPGRQSVEITGLACVKVRGSRYELMRVVHNLIKNAMESGATSIQVDIDRTDEGVRLSVRDNGPGMAPAEIKRALGGGYTTKANGTGLGLSICRHIIAAHGGRLTIKSAAGEGTQCEFQIPELA